MMMKCIRGRKMRSAGRMSAICCLPALAMAALAAATAGAAPVEFPAPDTAVSNITFVIFDFETTGFGPQYHRAVELGCVKFLNGNILEEKSWLINPERYIPYYARNVHHISNEMVKNAPVFKQIIAELRKFVKGAVMIAHNAPFDVGFMRAEFKRAGATPLRNPAIDSLSLFRHWYPKMDSYDLTMLVNRLNLENDVFHRATDDARYVAVIFFDGMKDQKGAYTWAELQEDAGSILSF